MNYENLNNENKDYFKSMIENFIKAIESGRLKIHEMDSFNIDGNLVFIRLPKQLNQN